jgi:hypothetical protein
VTKRAEEQVRSAVGSRQEAKQEQGRHDQTDPELFWQKAITIDCTYHDMALLSRFDKARAIPRNKDASLAYKHGRELFFLYMNIRTIAEVELQSFGDLNNPCKQRDRLEVGA